MSGSNFPQREFGLDYSNLHPSEVCILVTAQVILCRYLRSATTTLSSPHAVRDYLRFKLGTQEREVFMVIYLDAQHRVIDDEILFAGTLTHTSVYPREVVKSALARNASALVLAHNHPSGVAQPSQADRALTDALRRALDLVGVKVLDQLIVAGGEVLAFSERGLG